MGEIVVVGQLARDLVLQVAEIPDAGTAGDVSGRREMLGGKGANQAVAVAQLGVPVSLVAVAGDDFVSDQLLARAISDGIDVRRFGPGERIVFEPYTREMFERTHRWMESWELFDSATAARPRYEDAVIA